MASHTRFENVDEDGGDVEMIRMPIVGSGDGAGSGLASCAKSRVAIFAAGIFMTVAVFVMADMVVVPHGGRSVDDTPRNWTVEISLWEDERYHLDRNRTLVLDVASDKGEGEKRHVETNLEVRYNVTKFCGSRDWSYMRFAIDRFRTKESGESGDHDAEEAGDQFGNYVEEALTGHTFTANLSHDGCVTFRDETNVRSTIDYVLDRWLEGGSGNATAAARALLTEIGDQAAVDVEESAYNYMLSSPPNVSVAVNQTWQHMMHDNAEPVNMSFTLESYVAPGGERPVVSGASRDAVLARDAAYNSSDRAWLVVRSSGGQVLNGTEYLERALGIAGSGALIDASAVDGFSVKVDVDGTYVIGARSGLVLDAVFRQNTTMEVRLQPHAAKRFAGTLSSAAAAAGPPAAAHRRRHALALALAEAAAAGADGDAAKPRTLRVTASESETASGWIEPLVRGTKCEYRS